MANLKRRTFMYGSLFTASLWLSAHHFSRSQASESSAESALLPDESMHELVRGNTGFALDLYRFLATESESENLFFSPYSISAALAMTYAGARGITAAEMADVLQFSLASDQLHAAFANLQSRLESDVSDNYQLTIANQLWGQEDYPFLDEFLQLLQQHYGSGLETVDFAADPEAVRQVINDWVAAQTNGTIEDLIEPGLLTRLTRLVLTNAIYFKAKWLEPFNPELTSEEPFTIAPGQEIQVPMMKGGTYRSRYVALEDIKLLELFYRTGEQSMVVVLPNQVDGLAQLETQLTPSLIESWMAALDRRNGGGVLNTWLPKFKVSSAFKLNDTLSEMGMPSAFDDESADLSGMDGGVSPLYLQAVVHKAFVDVDEFGTEAAAATAVIVGTRSIRGDIYINRPFLFLIRDLSTQSIVFLGRVINPLE